MSTITLDPATAGNTAWTGTIADVDDGATPDEDTTYLSNTSTSGTREGIKCANVTTAQITNGSTINYVEMQARCRTTLAGSMALFVGRGQPATNTDQANFAPDASYTEYAYRHTVDPSTGVAWTIATLRDWANATANQTIFGVVNRSVVADLNRVTRIRVVIDFTLPPAADKLDGLLLAGRHTGKLVR